ncbi:conserved hypothetical protein [Methylovorus sp. MP688]|jgi:hypothetical protein|nr:conserved hypothetical protein [Methylovorus sp. MP688]
MLGENLTEIANLDLIASYRSHEHVLAERLIEGKSRTPSKKLPSTPDNVEGNLICSFQEAE